MALPRAMVGLAVIKDRVTGVGVRHAAAAVADVLPRCEIGSATSAKPGWVPSGRLPPSAPGCPQPSRPSCQQEGSDHDAARTWLASAPGPVQSNIRPPVPANPMSTHDPVSSTMSEWCRNARPPIRRAGRREDHRIARTPTGFHKLGDYLRDLTAWPQRGVTVTCGCALAAT